MLHGIQSATQIKALLSAMLAFALKGCDTSNESDAAHIDGNGSSSHFRGLALKLMDQAISECEDEPLPLPLLQALILITHGLLIQGVRARAWRYLGICVRSAYESNLHLVDSGKSPEDNTPDHVVDPARWCEDEERRRAWWAIWEMDVFASVIRRCPTAIDWSQNETFLPAEDERWARGEPQPSCMLKTGLVDRWKALQATGNQSPKAWFIVINSLMKDAQKISSPVGVDKAPDQRMSTGGNTTRDKSRKLDTSHTKDARNRLSAMQNSLYCTVMALPRTLKYEYQSIHFGTRDADPEQRSSIRLLHSSIYSIHVMVQLTKLMIYKYHIFRMDPMWPRPTSESGIPAGRSEDAATAPRPIGDHSSIEYQSLYFEAADEVMRIVRRSSPDQHKYVNPFLANSIWVAAAVQLLHRELVPVSSSNKERINSNFALLCMTYNQFVDYWSVSTTPQKTLDILEKELKRFEHDHHNGFWSTDGKSSRVVGDIGHNPATSRGEINADLVNSHVPLSAPDSTCDVLVNPHRSDVEQLGIASAGLLTNSSSPPADVNPESAQPAYHHQEPSTGVFNVQQGSQAPPQGDSRTSTGLGISITSLPEQMPGMLTPIPTNTPLGRARTISIPPFDTDAQSAVSPSLFDVFSLPRDLSALGNADFSSYLDEILSGSYVT